VSYSVNNVQDHRLFKPNRGPLSLDSLREFVELTKDVSGGTRLLDDQGNHISEICLRVSELSWPNKSEPEEATEPKEADGPEDKVETPCRDDIYRGFSGPNLLTMEMGDKVVDGDQVFMITHVDKTKRYRRMVTAVAIDSSDTVPESVTESREYSVCWRTRVEQVVSVLVGDVVWTPSGWHRVIAVHRGTETVALVFKSRANWSVSPLDTPVTIRKGHDA